MNKISVSYSVEEDNGRFWNNVGHDRDLEKMKMLLRAMREIKKDSKFRLVKLEVTSTTMDE